MTAVTLICGKICSGKSYYARQLAQHTGGVILSVDEEMLKINPTGLFGDKHEEVAAQVKKQLLDRCIRLAHAGVPVILDWGYWTRQDRRDAEAFCQTNGLSFEWHYIAVTDEQWRRNIAKRNQAVASGEEKGSFFVDDELLKKLQRHFEAPEPEEMIGWHICQNG